MKFEHIDKNVLRRLIQNEEEYRKVIKYLNDLEQKDKAEIKRIQKIGIERAKSQNVHFGRPATQLPDNFLHISALYEHKLITLKNALGILNISRATFYNKRKQYHKEIDEYYFNSLCQQNSH